MEAGTWIDVLLVLAFILVGGVFAATEIALVSLRSGQVERLDTQGGRGHAVASLARDPNRFLSAVQIGVTVAGFFSAAFGASTLAPSFAPVFEGLGAPAPDTVSLVVTTLVVSYLSLVLGELVPKRLALQRSVGVAKLFAPPLGKFATVMTPVIWLLSLSTNLLVRLLGGNPDAAGDEVDEEELRMMISGHEDIPEGERRLVDDVFEAGDRSLSEVMKPRGDVIFLRGDMSLAEAVAVIVEQPYTRYPVTGTSFDEVLGYLHLRDVLGRADDSATTVAAIARELPVLPRTNRVLPSIDQLRSLGRAHRAGGRRVRRHRRHRHPRGPHGGARRRDPRRVRHRRRDRRVPGPDDRGRRADDRGVRRADRRRAGGRALRDRRRLRAPPPRADGRGR